MINELYSPPFFPDYSRVPPDEPLTVTVGPSSYDYTGFIVLGAVLLTTYLVATA